MAMRIQPQGLTRIDRRHPIGADLVLSIHAGTGVREVMTSRPMTGRGSAQSIKGFEGGLAYDLRGTNTGAFIGMVGGVGQLCSDHTTIVDVVLNGAQSGATSPAIAGLWRSTSQHDAALAIERTGTGSITVTAKIGAAATSVARAFDIVAANLYGRRLTLAASITRGASGRRIYLRVASEGSLLYSFEDIYVLEANADLVPTGTEYVSIGSEQVENSTRNPNCIVYAQHHLARLVSADEVVALSVNPWQVYDDPREVEEEEAAAPAGPGATLTPAGAAGEQANLAGTGGIGQVQGLTGAGGAQASEGDAGSIGQTQHIAGVAGEAANQAGTSGIGQAQHVAGAAGTQANTGAVGSIGQTQILSGTAGTQGNEAGVGAATVEAPPVPNTSAGAPAQQENIGGTGTISQVQQLAASAGEQANEAGTGGIEIASPPVPDTLVGASGQQGNIGGTGAIAQVLQLAGAEGTQANLASIGMLYLAGKACIYMDPGESRVYDFPGEARTYDVPAERRLLTLT